jgi:citrate synthase
MTDGLEGVIAAETRLSHVDGARGELIICGYPLDALAGRLRFEEVAHLLLDGQFEERPDQAAFDARLAAARMKVFALAAHTDADLLALPPLEALRALLSRLPDGEDLDSAFLLLAAPGVLLPALLRLRAGQGAIAPDVSLSYAEDMLRMLHGLQPPGAQAAALDAYLVTISDHGLNASTFAARVVASTWAGFTSSVVAGLSALKGPLHGGAPGPVLDMLDSIDEPERAVPWIESALDRGDRLMGFGHRIYKVRDPRADALKAAVKKLALSSQKIPARLRLAEAVEQAALAILARRKSGRSLDVNVEFYTALLLETLGFPADAFTAVFATGRVAGWLAHAREQRLTGRLIRPSSRYIGPPAAAAKAAG